MLAGDTSLGSDDRHQRQDGRHDHVVFANQLTQLQVQVTALQVQFGDSLRRSLYLASMSLSVLEPNTNVVIYIERLLNTIDRLRSERDSLSRDVEFLESESRFTIEALEAKLSASISSASDKSVATINQQDVQGGLNNVEGHYTTLQSHQLSNMDSEATRNLREQIEELEDRVMRRTEQIGIHQHAVLGFKTESDIDGGSEDSRG